MGEKIAMGFHATVDYELEWDAEKFINLVSDHQIKANELNADIQPDSERNMLRIALVHMKEGSGAEFTPETNELCVNFAKHFVYRQTLGGTALRAALAIGRLGYGTELSICCFNRLVRQGIPFNVHYFSNIGQGREEIYPHVVLTYPSGARIKANDIDFVTPRENRILFSNDEEAKAMAVSQEFLPRMRDAKVFLLGCFSEVLDFHVLKQRMAETRELLNKRNPDTLLVMEDGCYIQKSFRNYVHKELMKCKPDILSMNEDELQEYVGKRFDILDADLVLDALEQCQTRIGVPLLVVHSSKWALAYGTDAGKVKQALETGICVSSMHFCYGNACDREELRRVSAMDVKREGEAFCKKIKELAGTRVCAVLTKDLSGVRNPTVVGLGDCFAAGLVLGLTELVLDL
ncbi:hypothetical protein NXH76_05525 [Blautia schinkii]|nr:hypothetical protein [Blautia schinkii]